MKTHFLYYLLLPLVVACKKPSTPIASRLPEVSKGISSYTYQLVTAANSIVLDTGTVYRLGLGQYASFFKFDRRIKNGNLYYEAIEESTRQLSPLKFYISNNGTGEVLGITNPSAEETEKFNKAWQR
ncbi:hypothetical protein [Chitinophaga pinensis]|uniref:Uncharacterized protein n=1 Tax=Chitinophaga pinensis (strain ATCC 43595 / DSM 2588 / LMG 13176 / NBRC 15968 / NCIMB 11800 / UQM 2034) TaxID=485918 RepID=A0A979G301_CHIPD|nr:hypothetical protein [Chitinophaga pinensis]ACU59982.1 hypothetical protein Cpin_2494 [Chitinophaga pinensis DSM 2588]